MKLFTTALSTLLALFLASCWKTTEEIEPNTDQPKEVLEHSQEAAQDQDLGAGMDEPSEPAMYASLDGLEMRNASTYGDFVFGGQPTVADLEALKARGVTKIVDLRTAAEDRGMDEPAVCEELGLEYVALPFSPSSLDDDVVNGILETMKGGGNTLVHCGSGNRVQLLFTMHRVLEEGVDVDAAMTAGREYGMSEGSETISRQLLSARQ